MLILTAKDALNDKVKGFNYGADDYLVKPFEREELLARIDAIIRRTNGAYKESAVEYKDLKLNIKSRKAFIGEEEIVLQGKQFDILEAYATAKETNSSASMNSNVRRSAFSRSISICRRGADSFSRM